MIEYREAVASLLIASIVKGNENGRHAENA